MRNQLLILFLFLSSSQLVFAGMAHVKMQGTVSAESGNYRFNSSEFPIEIWCDGNLLSTHFPSENGAYEIDLAFGMNYRIRFGSNPWVVKMVDVNLKTPFFPAGNIGYTLDNNISLFRHPQTSDFNFLDSVPVAVASFDYEANCMTWDTAYSEKLTDSIIHTLKQTTH